MTQLWAAMPYISYEFSGADARHFLQGQVTQDINRLVADSCRYAAYCTPKGRMLAAVVLYCDSDNRLFMRIHKRQQETVIKRLKRFVLRADVNITQQPCKVLGLNRSMAEALCRQSNVDLPKPLQSKALPIDCCKARLNALPNDYYELIINPQDMSWIERMGQSNTDALNCYRLRAGHFNILPETSEMFMPQQTPLADWDGISYQKGCYVGQEIIARNRYLAKGKMIKCFAVANLKHRVELFPGDKVNDHSKSIGQVIEYHHGEENGVCLALLPHHYIGKQCQVGGMSLLFSRIGEQLKEEQLNE
ncbi:MAG: hypothetical protein CSA45_02685 [Gammaproteobacteria bacterium]|nr:MAG: hypothetical protein CSA45_02685 [Gammaproteobacteria bacterium]